MRVLVLLTLLGGCAGITGLSDYTLVPDAPSDAGLADGSVDDGSVLLPDGGKRIVDASSVDAAPDAPPLVPPTVLFTQTPATNVLRAVTVSGGHIYYLNQTTSELARIDVSGANYVVLATNVTANQLIVDSIWIWTASAAGLGRFNLDGSSRASYSATVSGCMVESGVTLYGADFTNGRIQALALSATASTYRTVNKPWGVAFSSGHLVYTHDSTSIAIESTDDAAAPTDIWTGGSNVNCLTVAGSSDGGTDQGQIYFADYDAGTIERIAPDGTKHEILAAGQSHPTQIGIDAEYIYWSSGSQILRLSR